MLSTSGSGGSGGPNILRILKFLNSNWKIGHSAFLQSTKTKILKAVLEVFEVRQHSSRCYALKKYVQTLPVLRQKRIMRLFDEVLTWHETNCSFGDLKPGWSGGDSGARWTPVGGLNKRYWRLQDILLSVFVVGEMLRSTEWTSCSLNWK
jgi:hypothetical protein